jgi:quercetin dioxygenase-like cupin family protein
MGMKKDELLWQLMKIEAMKNKRWKDKGTYRTMKIFEITKKCFVQVVEVKPKSTVKKHYHRKQTEIFVVLDGRAKIGIDNKEYNVKTGDILLCKPRNIHWVINKSKKPFKLVVFKYNYVKNDTIWLE